MARKGLTKAIYKWTFVSKQSFTDLLLLVPLSFTTFSQFPVTEWGSVNKNKPHISVVHVYLWYLIQHVVAFGMILYCICNSSSTGACTEIWSDFFYYGKTWNGKKNLPTYILENVIFLQYTYAKHFALWPPSRNVCLLSSVTAKR